MKAIALAVMMALTAPSAATRFDSSRAWEHLRQLVAIGPRPAGSPAIDEARTYIRQQLAKAGVAVADQAWDERSTPIGRVHMVNLRATIPGASPDRLVIAGHYDTKLFHEFRFVGADDGGSSAAFLIELARDLKARRNPLTIEILFLDGEEAFNREWAGTDNTYGSRHYVDAAKQDGSLATLKAMILVDMIGDRDLRLKREASSTGWLTDIIWSTASRENLGDVLRAREHADRGRPPALPRGRRAVGRHHRSGVPGVAHRRRHARRRERPQPAGRRRHASRCPAGGGTACSR